MTNLDWLPVKKYFRYSFTDLQKKPNQNKNVCITLVCFFLTLKVHKWILTLKFKKIAIEMYSDCWQFLRETCKDQYNRFWWGEGFCKEMVSAFKHPFHGQGQNKNRNCLGHALKLSKFLKGYVHVSAYLKQNKNSLSDWFLPQHKNFLYFYFALL